LAGIAFTPPIRRVIRSFKKCISGAGTPASVAFVGPKATFWRILDALQGEGDLKGHSHENFFILILVSFESFESFYTFFIYPFFLQKSSFSYRILEYTTSSGDILLSHNTVNELCYVAGFVNSLVT
jgi:hypothetical protein